MKYITREQYFKAQNIIRQYNRQRDKKMIEKKVRQLAKLVDTSLAELKSPSTKRKLSDRRSVIATHILKNIPSTTEGVLAEVLNRDRTAISHMKKRYENLQTDPDFKQIIIKINH